MLTKHLGVLFALSFTLGACGTIDRLSTIGKPPPMSPIANPVDRKDYAPVNMPMPVPEQVSYAPNSLWRAGSTAFFRDQRAREVGDILTVNIAITDSATFDNTTKRSRVSSEDSNLTNLLGFEGKLAGVLPDGVSPDSLASFGSTTSNEGTGSIDRSEAVNLTVAALVIQTLPNGNLVIYARQEVRVNFEVRQLELMGVVRPEDISSRNTIDHTQIAEARISYGGKGHITDVQQERYLKQIYDVLAPF